MPMNPEAVRWRKGTGCAAHSLDKDAQYFSSSAFACARQLGWARCSMYDEAPFSQAGCRWMFSCTATLCCYRRRAAPVITRSGIAWKSVDQSVSVCLSLQRVSKGRYSLAHHPAQQQLVPAAAHGDTQFDHRPPSQQLHLWATG